MSPIATAAVATRRTLVKRPWIHWAFVALVALASGASVLERADRVDDERAAWGDTVTVLVAARPLAPGDPIVATETDIPRAMAPPGRLDRDDGDVVRQHVGVGEVITDVDVVARDGPQAMTPSGWLAVPVLESTPSGAELGDRVRVATDGIVVGDDAIVVGRHDDAVLVAVRATDAPLVAASAGNGGVTLLLVP